MGVTAPNIGMSGSIHPERAAAGGAYLGKLLSNNKSKVLGFLVGFKKGGGSTFDCMYFLCIFTDFSVNNGPILEILFLFEMICARGGPIVTKSEFNEGISWKRREILKLYKHVQCIS